MERVRELLHQETPPPENSRALALVPTAVLVVLYVVWELSDRRWDPARVAMPVVLLVGAFGFMRVQRWRERAVWPVAMVSLMALTAAVRRSSLGEISVTWLHDGRAAVGTAVFLTAMLWTVRAFEHYRRWQTWVDIANVAMLVGAAGAVWEAWPDKEAPYQAGIGWLTIGLSAIAAAMALVLLGAEVSWSVSARWLLAGTLAATVTRMAFLPGARYGWDEVWLSWVWVVSAALVGGAAWHPDAVALQVRRGALRRTRRRLSIVATVLALVVGYSLLAVAPLWSSAMWVGVIGVTLTSVRAVLALRLAWRMQLAAEEALRREREARDSEQRALQKLVQEDVSQLLSAASWLVENGEPRSLLLEAEEASLQVLQGFRPVVPAVEEIPAALAEVLERFPSGPRWSFDVTADAVEERRGVVWGVVREAAVNVMKHARAENAWVHVKCSSAGCTVVVEDDGVGIRNRMNGLGLSNLKTLVGGIGGTIEASERDGGGTRVEARLPGVDA